MDWLLVTASVAGVVFLPALVVVGLKVYIRWTMGECRSQNRLDDKVVIITGANSGIGKKAAENLAARGAKIILACRSLQRATAAVEAIRSRHPESKLVIKQLDLCSLQSVRSFAADVLRDEARLDILINNAGISGGDFRRTGDDFEEIFQANYLGPFLLTELLLPLLKRSAPARIVNVGSCAMMLGSVDAETLAQDVRSSFTFNLFRYSDTKMAMMMWTRALAEELNESGVTVNVIHPGVVKTPIAAKSITLSNLVLKMNIFIAGRTAEEGAQTILHLSLSDEGGTVSGRYWADCKPSKLPRYPGDMGKNRRVAQATRDILEKYLDD